MLHSRSGPTSTAGAAADCRARPGRDLGPVTISGRIDAELADRVRKLPVREQGVDPAAVLARGGDAGGTTVAHHRSDRRIAHGRIERHHGHARLAGAEQQQRHFSAVLHQHREPRSRRETQLQQTVRHLVRRSVEPGPGPPTLPAEERRLAGLVAAVLDDQVGDDRPRYVVPAHGPNLIDPAIS